MAVHRCSFLSGWDRQGGARGRVPALWRGGPRIPVQARAWALVSWETPPSYSDTLVEHRRG
jgi:hypothetical protein